MLNGYLDLLAASPLREEQRRAIESLQVAGDRLNELLVLLRRAQNSLEAAEAARVTLDENRIRARVVGPPG